MNHISQTFFTSSSGYKMKVEVYANGFGDGIQTHLTVSFHILECPFDSQLSWPLLATFKLELLNQLEDSNHHVEYLEFIDHECSRHGASKGWGLHKFIEHSELKLDLSRNIQYLKDDLLYFRVCLENTK